MESSVRRAAGFAAVATIALATPVAGALVAVPFALIAVVGRTLSEGMVFELFASPEDRLAGELRGLVGFSLAATALALLSALSGLPETVFVVTVLLIGYGNLGERLAAGRSDSELGRPAGFVTAGMLAALGGPWLLDALAAPLAGARSVALLAVSGALFAALVRATFARGDDPVVMVTVALGLWVLSSVRAPIEPGALALAGGVAGGFGLLSWLLGTASITGMLAGIIVGLLTIVLGGYGWFVVFLAFAGVGGLASKYRYEEKQSIDAEEENEGARRGRNVLGNTGVALLSLLGFAAGESLSVDPRLFLFAFVGSLATAMSDTLSSEVGMVLGRPRLITTLEPVETGADGGISVPGSAAGLAGAALVATITYVLLGVGAAGAVVVMTAGVIGMLADSLFGATVEGRWIGNQSVNFLATLVGAVLSAVGAMGVGL